MSVSIRVRGLLLAATAISMAGSAAAYVPQPAADAEPSAPLAAKPAARPLQQTPVPVTRTSDAMDFNRLLADLGQQERQLAAFMARTGPELKIVKSRMNARGRAYYRLMRAGLLPIGGGFQALVDHATRVERLRAALGRDVELKTKLEKQQKKAGAVLRKVRAERAPLLIQREAMTRARSAMRQAEERRDAFTRAFGGNLSVEPHVAVYGASPIAGETSPLRAFAEMKGRLSFPVSGRAEILRPVQPTTELSGINLVASRDAAIRAVHGGQVTFVGPTGHGLTVVLQHGGGYYTVYGSLERAEVRRGDAVQERARLGWVLKQTSRRPTLYFEVRQGQQQLDASDWLGL